MILFESMNLLSQVGEWAWIHGPNLPNTSCEFGTEGIPSPSVIPCPSYGPASWIDNDGNLWTYGGVAPEGGVYDDLWKYDPDINMWAWMGGSAGTIDVTPVYGTQGVESPSNNPGGRGFGSASWLGNDGNLYMFGGIGFGFFDKGDLWKYNISTGNWVWLSGTIGNDTYGVYGTQGVPSTSNFPTCRHECTANWVDQNGNFWMFGGYSAGDDSFNDMWRYNPSTNEWTWMKGTQFGTEPNAGVYGTLGVPGPSNTPAGRQAYTSWKDDDGNFWLFGGGYMGSWPDFLVHEYNDLWMYNPTTNEWAWMNGTNQLDNTGSQGASGIEDPSNMPSSRFETRSHMRDQCENFYFFGGLREVEMDLNFEYDGEILTDLWKYSKSTNMFTWIGGTDLINANGVYGTLGEANELNYPGSRSGAIQWMDQNSVIRVYGGNAGFSTTEGDPWPLFNDMWTFSFLQDMCNDSLPPVADFEINDSIFCGQGCISLVNQSLYALEYNWSFPGGNPSSSNIANPGQICYDTPGNFPVTLIVTNAFGSDTLVWNEVIVFPLPQTPVLTLTGDSLFFTENTDYAEFNWFVNGLPSGFDTNGFAPLPYDSEISLVVYTTEGCTDTAFYFTDGPPPNAMFQVADSLLCTGECITFQNQSEFSNSYTWNFAGGNPSISNLENPTVCYDQAGEFEVLLVVENEQGIDSAVFQFIIVELTPLAPELILVGDTLFADEGIGDVDLQWWVNGDLDISSDLWLTNLPFNAVVELIVLNGNCTDTSLFETPGPPPIAGFDIQDSILCAGDCISFFNASQFASSYYWEFQGGNPSTSNEPNPVVCYDFPGDFDVQLTASNNEGADTTIVQTIISVHDYPIGNLWQSADSVLLSDDGSADVVTWLLNGSTLLVEDSVVYPAITGLYNVFLINSAGCVTDLELFATELQEHFVYIPNCITTDGDQLNETWFVYGDQKNWTTFKASIFNRWGEEIFTSTDPYRGWTGNARNGNYFVPDGVYVYKVEIGFADLIDVKTFTGHVTLLR